MWLASSETTAQRVLTLIRRLTVTLCRYCRAMHGFRQAQRLLPSTQNAEQERLAREQLLLHLRSEMHCLGLLAMGGLAGYRDRVQGGEGRGVTSEDSGEARIFTRCAHGALAALQLFRVEFTQPSPTCYSREAPAGSCHVSMCVRLGTRRCTHFSVTREGVSREVEDMGKQPGARAFGTRRRRLLAGELILGKLCARSEVSRVHRAVATISLARKHLY